MDIRDQLSRFLQPLSNRIRNMITKCVIKSVEDDKKIQLLTVSLLARELKSGVERFQNYGFSSHPLPGMEGIAVFPAGDRSQGIIIAVGDRSFRVKDSRPGEVFIYTDEGDTIALKRNHNVEITTTTLTVNAKHGNFICSEDVSFQTDVFSISASSISMEAYQSVSVISPDTSVSGAASIAQTLNVGDTLSVSGNITGQAEVSDIKGSMNVMRVQYNSHGGHTTEDTLPNVKM